MALNSSLPSFLSSLTRKLESRRKKPGTLIHQNIIVGELLKYKKKIMSYRCRLPE